MKSVRRIVAILLAMVMVFGLAACGTPSNNGGGNESNNNNATPVDPNAPQYGGDFVIARSTGPRGLFGLTTSIRADYVNPAIESLCRRNPYTEEIEPLLAKSWDVDNEAHTVTFHLNEGIKFHDGSDFDAEAVKWNYDLLIANKLGTSMYNPTLEVIDKYTVKFQFDKFYLDMLRACCTTGLYSKEAYEKNGAEWCENHPIGTGAFIFKEFIPDNEISYTRNDNYWKKDENGNQLPYLDTYTLKILADANQTANSFINGDVHAINITADAVVAQLQSAGFEPETTVTFTSPTIYGFAPNGKVEGDPWANEDVRKAVMLYGLNYEEIALLAGGKRAINDRNICTKGSLCYVEDLNSNYKYDLEKAKKMLADAGYPNGFKTVIHTINMTKSLATVLQEKFKDLGIEAEVDEMASNDPKRTDGVTPGVFLFFPSAAYDSIPRPFGSVLNQTSKSNGANMKFSDEYQELYLKAVNSKTEDERAGYGKELVKKLCVDECLLAVGYMSNTAIFINKNFHNTGIDALTQFPEITWMSK